MNDQKIFEEILKLQKKCEEIAGKYANMMQDYGGALYSPVYLQEKEFGFSYGPSTHGMSKYVTLPYSVLNNELELTELVSIAKQKIKKDIEENTCKACGRGKWSI